jgi:hypothetical protein
MRSIILSSLNKCHDQMADDPESTTDPEPEPRPETISDPPTEFRKRSIPKRRRHRSGAEIIEGSQSIHESIRSPKPIPKMSKPKDIFNEERRKKKDDRLFT